MEQGAGLGFEVLRVPVDHLVYAVPELGAGIDGVERMLGVRAAPGGKHPGGGTHNALLSLGRGAYLEIIAPDVEQPAPERSLPFGLDRLREPRLVMWVMRVRDMDEQVAKARDAGYDPSEPIDMSRSTPDGSTLRWRLTYRPFPPPGDGVVPYLIEWEPGQHPSETSPAGCHLLDLEGEHPHPGEVQRMLAALDVDLTVTEAGRPALIATIECPRGQVVLS